VRLGLGAPSSKAADVVAWFKEDYGLGRGHAMAFWQVLRNGPTISDKHVGSSGSHRDDSQTLWLEGKAMRPAN
jgi:hypothetical protein